MFFFILLRQFTNASSPPLLKTGSQTRLLENQVVSWSLMMRWPLWCFLKQDIEQEEEFLAQEMSHVPHKVSPSWWNCRSLIKVKFFTDQVRPALGSVGCSIVFCSFVTMLWNTYICMWMCQINHQFSFKKSRCWFWNVSGGVPRISQCEASTPIVYLKASYNHVDKRFHIFKLTQY